MSCGCRFRLRVPVHQATDTQVHSLGARDIECRVFEHQHSLRRDCSRSDHRLQLWCEGVLCSLIQSSTAPKKRSSFITLETPNSTQQQLHVDHRILDRLAGNLPVRSAHTSPPAPAVSLSYCRRCCRPLIVMDVRVVHPGSNSRCPPRKCSISTLSTRQQPPSIEPGVSKAGKTHCPSPPTR